VVHAQGVEGTDYRKIEPPQPPTTPGKIEVIEFFSYMCPHCKEFYPLVSTWAAQLPKNVVFRRVPVWLQPPGVGQSRARLLRAAGERGSWTSWTRRCFARSTMSTCSCSTRRASRTGWARTVAMPSSSRPPTAPSASTTRRCRPISWRDKYHADAVPTMTVNGEYLAMGKNFAEILANTDRLIAQVQTEARAKGTPKHP